MKIYIDVGHGENGDPGACSNGLVEHQMNIVTANALAERLRLHGHEVMIEPGNLELTSSARAANAYGADLLVSCHYNAGGGERGEVIYGWKDGSLELANAVAKGLYKLQNTVKVYKSKANSTGTAEYFGILRAAKMPCVIVEPAFIDNANDRKKVDTPQEQKNVGYMIADGIIDFYGGKEEAKVDKKTGDNPSDWAKEHTEWAKAKQIVNGDGQGNYDWQGTPTREGLAAILHNFAVVYKLEKE